MTAAITYRYYTQNAPRIIEAISERPQVSRASEQYLENIEKVSSVDAFMADERVYNYVMTAYGLSDMAYAKAFIRKVLEGGTDDPNSFANRLTDKRYKELAEDFNFPRYGEITTTFERTRSGVVERYMRTTFEADAGNDNDGARLALYFERRIGDADIDSPYDILADRALLETVRTAFSLPAELSLLPIEKQAAIIEDKLDIEKLSDPEYVQEFLNRFAVLWDMANPTTSTSVPAIVPLSGSIQTISADLLTTIQGLKSRP